ncbi:hypothetical protein PMAYCL1PPCAC_14544, partial [Pristionchus mayeri]
GCFIDPGRDFSFPLHIRRILVLGEFGSQFVDSLIGSFSLLFQLIRQFGYSFFILLSLVLLLLQFTRQIAHSLLQFLLRRLSDNPLRLKQHFSSCRAQLCLTSILTCALIHIVLEDQLLLCKQQLLFNIE